MQETESPPIREHTVILYTNTVTLYIRPGAVPARREGRCAHIDKHVLLPILRPHKQHEPQADDEDDRPKGEEARSQKELLERRNGRGGLYRRAVKGDDDGAEDAEAASDLAEEGESLFQEDRRENSAACAISMLAFHVYFCKKAM